MAYSEKFVVAVIVNGDIVREQQAKGENNVLLPFGSDYSLRLKNLHSQKALVKIEIDGKDVLGGDTLLLEANSTMDLDGFLTGNVVKNKFRFIQKTKEIINYRGDKIDDGFIRVEWQFEEAPPVIEKKIVEHIDYWRYNPWYYPDYSSCRDLHYKGTIGSSLDGPICSNAASEELSYKGILRGTGEIKTQNFDPPILTDEGITVKGAETNQQFIYASVGKLEEQKHTIVIRLKGVIEDKNQVAKAVQKVVLTHQKVRCSSCGRQQKSSSKYCPNCGTAI